MSQFLAGDYTPAERQLALSTYLSLARILGDFTDQLVVQALEGPRPRPA